MVHDKSASAKELTEDYNKINNWAYQWKISFNSDPSKQAQDVLCSSKLHEVPHPKFFLKVQTFRKQILKNIQFHDQISKTFKFHDHLDIIY